MKVFFDTSAFAKRYIEEPGSDEVARICLQADQLVLSIICLPELLSTLNRLVREKKIQPGEYQETKDLIAVDLRDINVCNLTPEVISLTIQCLERATLRAMDAIHLACALVTEPDLFVSSDQRQITAARRVGLKVVEV